MSTVISTELEGRYGMKVSSEQVRWKINSLLKRYREIGDNMSRSGHGRMDFHWFEVMDNLFENRERNVGKARAVVSSALFKDSTPSTSEKNESAPTDSNTITTEVARKRPDPTDITRKNMRKNEMQTTLTAFMEKYKIYNENRMNMRAKKIQRRQELLNIKRQKVSLQQEMLQEKRKMFRDLIETERAKLKTLKRLMKCKNKNKGSDSTSTDSEL